VLPSLCCHRSSPNWPQILAFGVIPDAYAVLGAALIVCTNIVVTVAKYRRAKMGSPIMSKPFPTNILPAALMPSSDEV
jgi:hypothetical protein